MNGGDDMKQMGGGSKRKHRIRSRKGVFQQDATWKTERMTEWVSFCIQYIQTCFFWKAKTNIYLFIINCCQHCRVSSKRSCFTEVSGLCFDCQDFKINDLYCWRTSIGQYASHGAAHPRYSDWPAENHHLCQTQADTGRAHRAHHPSPCISLLFGERLCISLCHAVPPLTCLSPPVLHIYTWRHEPD